MSTVITARTIQSMSRKGSGWDNAAVESFIGNLTSELVYRKTFETQSHATESSFKYIEVFNYRKDYTRRYTI